jgi:hypothetical protein
MKKSDLLITSPLTALYNHIDSLNLPECVTKEIWEQEKFFSYSQISNMTNWNYDHFISWYNNNNL